MARRVCAPQISEEERLRGFGEIMGGLRAQMAVAESTRCLLCENPPCEAGCPAGVEVRRFIRMMRSRNFRGALNVIRSRNLLAAICARVCPQSHLCEGKCSSSDLAEPIAIGLLQRFVADEGLGGAPSLEVRPPSGKRVAVVGSGPAGLSCAGRLAILGHEVTIFEARAFAGGLLTYGIPPYRLPRAVLFKEIDIIRGLGVSVLTDHPVENPALLLDEGFDAVFLACGLWGRGGTRIKGCDLKGVLHWIDFLAPLNEKLAEGDSPSIALGNEVIVIGGGNAAIDCARSAARLGAIVTILYRRVEPDMPAWEEERRAAREENISLECCVAPVEYFGEGGVLKGVRLVRTSQGEPDGTGRCRPVPMEGSEFAMNCDTVIEAVGLRSDPKAFPDRLWKDGLIEVREGGFYTMLPGIFAGGDVVSGGATVVRAVADGAGAAEEIDVFLAHGAD